MKILVLAFCTMLMCYITPAAYGVCDLAGKVVERSNGKQASITVNLTDVEKKIKNPTNSGFPMTVEVNQGNNFSQTITIGTLVGGELQGFPGICDVEQTTKILGNTGEVADLSLESIVYDPNTRQFVLQDLFATIGAKVGFGTPVPVPDLFADTNGDGIVGEGDILYSLVDVNQYVIALPSFSLGDTFHIVNGVTPALPGMLFSSTPFTYSATTGIQGTPVTLDGTTDALHEITSIPEPATLLSFSLGILGVIGRINKRSRSFRVGP